MSRALERQHARSKNVTVARENAPQREPPRVHILLAEHTLSTPITVDSLLELRKAFRTYQTNFPISTCAAPLDASILKMTTVSLLSASSLRTGQHLFAHTLISVESFLASLSLLGSLSDWTEQYPSVSALFCDAILRQDPYRDNLDISIARLIMEHIDRYHEIISRDINIEIGSTYIHDPLPGLSDEHCRCPLQLLEALHIPKNRPDALAETASMHLVEVEKFNAAQGLVDLLAAAKYFHSFELRMSQLAKASKDSPTSGVPTHDIYPRFALPRASRLQGNYTNGTRARL